MNSFWEGFEKEAGALDRLRRLLPKHSYGGLKQKLFARRPEVQAKKTTKEYWRNAHTPEGRKLNEDMLSPIDVEATVSNAALGAAGLSAAGLVGHEFFRDPNAGKKKGKRRG